MAEQHTKKVDFATFYAMWAVVNGWSVPDFHFLVCDFLQTFNRIGLLMMPRGHAKSTILGVYNAWRYYVNPQYRILHQGDQDATARKTSRDVKSVLNRHPLTREQIKLRGDVDFWWINGSEDERNPSMQASGILSNITSSRADEIQNDDVEVPRNISSAELREKLRYRLSEQIHILVPNGKRLFVGTPHTYETIYKEIKDLGADCLVLKMFNQEQRIDNAVNMRECFVSFEPDYIFVGVGKNSQSLKKDEDYIFSNGKVIFHEAQNGLIDFYKDALWPERFTPDEMANRRKECRLINEWDSQYQLHAKPVHEMRLKPDLLKTYNDEPVFREVNKTIMCKIGERVITGCRVYWDVSLGKIGSDGSVITVLYSDDVGNLFWHYTKSLFGEIDDQCAVIRDIVKRFALSCVTVETNGVGGFVPAILRKALNGLGCSVVEHTARGNKEQRILQAIESPLSGGYLWAHESIYNTDAVQQMSDFNPAAKNQKDDYLDSLSGAILLTPVKIKRAAITSEQKTFQPIGRTITADLQSNW